ncbi:MAG: hypothetical protein U0K53_07475, partial [Paludibacteraceae bacterium]|nr:hypothetical protein [Paludibacteraceae bacterium]
AVTALQQYLLYNREPSFSKAGAKVEHFSLHSKYFQHFFERNLNPITQIADLLYITKISFHI